MKVDDLLHLPLDEYMLACSRRHAELCNSTEIHRLVADMAGYEGFQFARIMWMRDWYEHHRRIEEAAP